MILGPILIAKQEGASRWIWALLVALFCFAAPAAAHQVNLSTARIVLLPDRTVSVDVGLKGSDIDRTVGTQLYDAATDRVNPAKVREAHTRIVKYILENVAVSAVDGVPCQPSDPVVSPDGDGVVVQVSFSCAATHGDLVYHSAVLTADEPAARQIVLIGAGEDADQALLDATETNVVITAPSPPLWSTLQRYLLSGIEHIFLGYDHIAFLIAILLWADRIWPVVKAVTAFTIAHSITLSLAALGVISVPGAIVEAAIAASILFVALENFFSRNVDRRWWITFPFGLIHGLGFASALQAFGLPQAAVIPALAAFNIGVEIGQIAIVLIVLPTLMSLDRLLATSGATPSRPRALVFVISGMIAALAARWLLLRTELV